MGISQDMLLFFKLDLPVFHTSNWDNAKSLKMFMFRVDFVIQFITDRITQNISIFYFLKG